MNMNLLSQATHAALSGQGNPAPKIYVPIRDKNLASEIASAYAGLDYGKAKMIDAIRGGYNLEWLKSMAKIRCP